MGTIKSLRGATITFLHNQPHIYLFNNLLIFCKGQPYMSRIRIKQSEAFDIIAWLNLQEKHGWHIIWTIIQKE